MIALCIIGGILLLLAIVLIVPVGVKLFYKDELIIKAYVFGIPISLVKHKEKIFDQDEQSKSKDSTVNKEKSTSKKEKPKKKRIKKLLKERRESIKQDGIQGVIQAIEEDAMIIQKASNRIIDSIIIRCLKIHITVRSNDASKNAMLYGGICEAIFPSVSLFECRFKTIKTDVQIIPDFNEGKIDSNIYLHIHIKPWLVVWAALCFILSFLKKPNNKPVEEVQ